jgi:hypothetical protein
MTDTTSVDLGPNPFRTMGFNDGLETAAKICDRMLEEALEKIDRAERTHEILDKAWRNQKTTAKILARRIRNLIKKDESEAA